MESVREVQSAATFALTEYFPASARYRRAYLRRNLRLPDGSVTPFVRQLDPCGLGDGVFVDRDVDDLAQFIAAPGEAEPVQHLDWPVSDKGRTLGVLMEFDPPLVYLPPTICANEAAVFQAGLRVYDRWGHPLRTGTAKRTIRMEGYETIEADGVVYEVCLRLAAETHIRLRWGPRIDVTEYLWLARGVGEVKRAERIQALAFLFYSDVACAYELVAGQDPTVREEGYRPPRMAAWARVAIFVDRLLPRLRVGGILVEYAGPYAPGAGGHSLGS